jgi:hypothetical protein
VLQELAAQTGATAFAIASMLFFLVVWVAITLRVFTTRREDLDARARLALEGDDAPGSDLGATARQGRRTESGAGTEA